MSYLLVISLFLSVSFSAYADAATTFKKKCGSCHAATIGGNTIGRATMGPDLTGIASIRDAEYLHMYITDPNKARKKYPDIYNSFKSEYKMKMPPVKLDDETLNELIDALQ